MGTKIYLIVCLFCLSFAVAADDGDLAKQVQLLSDKIEALEARITQLEGARVEDEQAEQQAQQSRDDQAAIKVLWAKIRHGMTKKEVIEVLGEPLSKRRGPSEYWFYSEQKSAGPHVVFLFGKVNAWVKPAS